MLPLFATSLTACTGGIRVSFMQPHSFQIDLKWSAGGLIIGTYLDKIYKHTSYVCTYNLGHTSSSIEELLWLLHMALLF